jgi:hypothetical protein
MIRKSYNLRSCPGSLNRLSLNRPNHPAGVSISPAIRGMANYTKGEVEDYAVCIKVRLIIAVVRRKRGIRLSPEKWVDSAESESLGYFYGHRTAIPWPKPDEDSM